MNSSVQQMNSSVQQMNSSVHEIIARRCFHLSNGLHDMISNIDKANSNFLLTLLNILQLKMYETFNIECNVVYDSIILINSNGSRLVHQSDIHNTNESVIRNTDSNYGISNGVIDVMVSSLELQSSNQIDNKKSSQVGVVTFACTTNKGTTISHDAINIYCGDILMIDGRQLDISWFIRNSLDCEYSIVVFRFLQIVAN